MVPPIVGYPCPLWTFFRIVHELVVLKGPPVRSGRATSDPFQTDFAAGGTSEWASGVRLVYDQHFSRSRPRRRHSYSVPLRPDIALLVPDGRKSHLHLFDAKVRVHGLADVGFAGSDKDGDDDKAGERAGSFKRGDIYKMHAYWDAVLDARSVSSVLSGNQAVSSPVGVAGRAGGGRRDTGWSGCRGKTGGGGRGAATNVEPLRETLRRMLGGGGGMSTTPYIL